MMAPAAKLSISVAATIIMAGCISSDNVEVTSEAPPLPPAAESYSINSRGDSIKEPYQCEYTSARDYHGQEREYRGNHRPWWDPSGWGASGDGSDQVTMNVGDRDNIRIVIVGEGADFKSFWLEIDPAFKIISGETQASEAYPSREKIVQIFEIEVEAITATGHRCAEICVSSRRRLHTLRE